MQPPICIFELTSTSQKFIFEISTPMSHTFFELGEFWWISKNGENGFESDDLWFQQLRLSCHFWQIDLSYFDS